LRATMRGSNGHDGRRERERGSFLKPTALKLVFLDVAFLGLFAGSASWACDMGFRGYIVDYLRSVFPATCVNFLLTVEKVS